MWQLHDVNGSPPSMAHPVSFPVLRILPKVYNIIIQFEKAYCN